MNTFPATLKVQMKPMKGLITFLNLHVRPVKGQITPVKLQMTMTSSNTMAYQRYNMFMYNAMWKQGYVDT